MNGYQGKTLRAPLRYVLSVRALTGIDLDRSKESQEDEMSDS